MLVTNSTFTEGFVGNEIYHFLRNELEKGSLIGGPNKNVHRNVRACAMNKWVSKNICALLAKTFVLLCSLQSTLYTACFLKDIYLSRPAVQSIKFYNKSNKSQDKIWNYTTGHSLVPAAWQKNCVFNGMTSSKILVLPLEVWEGTSISLMSPWSARMVSRWRYTRWF